MPRRVHPVPARSTRQRRQEASAERLLQAKLPARLVKALRILALEQDTTVKALLTRLVEDYLAKRRRAGGGRG
jgi:hypothetical protein